MNPIKLGVLFACTLLTSALLAGCGTSVTTPPVTSLSEDPAAGNIGVEDSAIEVATTNASASGDSTLEIARARVEPNRDSPAQSSGQEPLRYTVRKAATPKPVATIPPVLFSAGHAKLCSAKVGDSFPALSLPRLGGPTTELATLRGQQATVVLFWHPDRWMARTALIDMQRDIASQFDAKQVSVVGIAVQQPMGAVQEALNRAQTSFPQLLDSNGQAFAKVGTAGLPRLYVLDPTGKIVWFDIEYSEGTRRELWQTLKVLTKP